MPNQLRRHGRLLFALPLLFVSLGIFATLSAQPSSADQEEQSHPETTMSPLETIALGDGESMRFRVSWGLFTNAGEITVAARGEELEGLKHTRVTTRTATSGLVRKLYKLDAQGDCLFDAHDGRLLAAITKSTSGKKRSHSMAVFNYIDGTLNYQDYLRPENSGQHPIPKSQAMDLITCLVQARAWDMKPGDTHPITAIFEDDFYDLTVTATGYEMVKTPWGEVNTLVLVPAPTPGSTPRGMFRKGANMRVWISQDGQRLPVKFELALKYGTGTAHLTDYTPPLATTIAAVENDPASSKK